MSKLSVTFAGAGYDRMQPLANGEVAVDGIELKYVTMEDTRQTFDRMMSSTEFDAGEMSSSEFISQLAAGQCPFVAIPVFPLRIFRHGFICINRKSGIATPEDLEGKRIGVPIYTMTAAIYIRGLLQHEYGVNPANIRWIQGAMDKPGAHGNPRIPPLLRPMPIELNETGQSLSDLLAAGEIDATLGSHLPASLGRHPDVRRLFPDYPQIEKDYYRRTGIFPIMHLVIIRRSLYERHPFVAASLFKALCESRQRALAAMKQTWGLRYMLPWMLAELEEIDAVFGGDPWPYGIEANRPTLEALVSYMQEQGLIAATMPVDKLFVPVGNLH